MDTCTGYPPGLCHSCTTELFSVRKWRDVQSSSRRASKSWIRNPLSAITSSPALILFRKPLSCTKRRSDAEPDHRSETKVKAPLGDIETKILKVLLCLYDDQVILCDEGIDGF